VKNLQCQKRENNALFVIVIEIETSCSHDELHAVIDFKSIFFIVYESYLHII